jgi:mannose-6-phosphate isomerase-like protein (cupin superfamily)
MPDGYKIPPHFHPTDEVVEVKEGTFLVGMGDTFDPRKTSPMKQGEKGAVPANTHHFAIARGATVVAVSARGPFAMTYVNPADDPQKKPSTP